MKPAPDYRPALKLVSLDIETTAQGELYSIALEGCGERQVYMLGRRTTPTQWTSSSTTATPAPNCSKAQHWLARHDPDAIIGWNLVQFDLRVLHEHASASTCRCCWGVAARDGLARTRQPQPLLCRSGGAADHRRHRGAALGDLEL
jgi:DNA polymerase elongation subunit (family B)